MHYKFYEEGLNYGYLSFVFHFKDPATVYAHSLITAHHEAMWNLILILAIVYWGLFKIVKDYNWYAFNKQPWYLIFFFQKMYFYAEFIFFFTFIQVIYYFFRRCLLFFDDSHYYFIADRSTLEADGNYRMASLYYDFLRGFEHMVGDYEMAAFFNKFPVNPNDKTGNLFSFEYVLDWVYARFLEKFFFNLLFNKLNVAYYYYNDTKNNNRFFLTIQRFHHSTDFEFACAFFPTAVILLILIPSTLLLYSLDEELEPLITYKVIGHQWFWSYEFNNWLYSDDVWKKVSYNFDSSMLSEDELVLGDKRLLEVNKPLFVPINIPLRFLITSGDVLHSWAVPELGIKIDAVPGRLSHYLVLVRRPGFFFGQCSELCGVAHAFMPIVIKAI